MATKVNKTVAAKPTNGKSPAAKPRRRESIDRAFQALRQLIDESDSGAIAKPGLKGGKDTGGKSPAPLAEATQIQLYEDDPFLKAVAGAEPVPAEPISGDVPENDHELLQTAITGNQPDPDVFDPGTPEFLYWNAESALARGINFWAPLLPKGTVWSAASPLPVALDAGIDLNAFFARDEGLKFFHDEIEGDTVFSVESPDVVCHELGHALLDALKPELFDAMSLEVGAFHESFGDMSGMLCALQLPSMREFVLEETGGDLTLNSRLSQTARELGWAIRTFAPDAVDADCLRNAANSFFYRDPATLPPDAPATELSSEVHSFSRVFSGAFLVVLAGMFEIGPATSAADDSEKLAAVAEDAGRLLIEGVRIAPVGASYFSQVAAGMIQADQSLFGGRYRTALIGSFVRRGILAPESAVALARDLRAHAGREFGIAAVAPRTQHLQFEGDNEGYKKSGADAPSLPLRPLTTRFGATFHVHMPTESNRFGVASAAVAGGAEPSSSAEEDARSFVEDLIQLGRISDEGAPGVIPAELIPATAVYPTDKTHRLVKEDGKVVLKRHHFCCGFRGSFGCRRGQ